MSSEGIATNLTSQRLKSKPRKVAVKSSSRYTRARSIMNRLFLKSRRYVTSDFHKNKIKTESFLLKVLTSISEMQCSNTCYALGIAIADIISYMEGKYVLDGDIHAQIRTSLRQACAYGYVAKNNNKYSLIGPMAQVVGIPHDRAIDRAEHIKRVQKIYWCSRVRAYNTRRRYETTTDDDRPLSTVSGRSEYTARTRTTRSRSRRRCGSSKRSSARP